MTLARPWACLTCDFVGCPPAGSKGECLATHFADSTRCEFGELLVVVDGDGLRGWRTMTPARWRRTQERLSREAPANGP